MSRTSGETVTEVQVGTGTDEQEKRQPTTAQRKTTKKRQGKSGEADTIDESTGEASLVSGKAVDPDTGEERQQGAVCPKTTSKRRGKTRQANKVGK